MQKMVSADLTGRTFSVRYDETITAPKPGAAGIPQPSTFLEFHKLALLDTAMTRRFSRHLGARNCSAVDCRTKLTGLVVGVSDRN